MYVWAIHGEEANGSNGGHAIVYAFTDGATEIPDPKTALEWVRPQSEFYAIDKIVCLGELQGVLNGTEEESLLLALMGKTEAPADPREPPPSFSPWGVALEFREDEPNQASRLYRTLMHIKYACGINTVYKIAALNDHKGDLTVKWKSTPTQAETKAAEVAWESQGECASNVYQETVA